MTLVKKKGKGKPMKMALITRNNIMFIKPTLIQGTQ
jgi:predicted transcriptional regulator